MPGLSNTIKNNKVNATLKSVMFWFEKKGIK